MSRDAALALLGLKGDFSKAELKRAFVAVLPAFPPPSLPEVLYLTLLQSARLLTMDDLTVRFAESERSAS